MAFLVHKFMISASFTKALKLNLKEVFAIAQHIVVTCFTVTREAMDKCKIHYYVEFTGLFSFIC